MEYRKHKEGSSLWFVFWVGVFSVVVDQTYME